MQSLVLASNNPGKLREFSELFTPLEFQIVPQTALGVPEAAEPYPSFIENALAKARNAARYSGLAALADDSGICAAALNGAPGVHSARYAGEPRSDVRNNQKLAAALADKADRRVHYYCAIVLVRDADDPEPLIAEGRWYGEFIQSPRGNAGFGYDPHFLVPGLNLSAAELDAKTKHSLSHRGRALRRLLSTLHQQAAEGAWRR